MNIRIVQHHRFLFLILIAFLILGVTYSIVTPIFEAGDELWHYPFVQSLSTGHGLPVQDPNIETLWAQEGGQPPLYYVVSALATFWIDTRDLPDRLWRNPHARIGIPLDYGNKNMVVHTSAENFPWQNTTLAVHLIRFLSIIFSAITVVLTYFFALEIKNDKRLAALAAFLVAFNPMFIFISASVNNDNLATMLATLALLLLAQLVTRGATMQRFVMLGVVLGLGALTKISNTGLFVVAVCVFAHLLWQSIDRRRQTADGSDEGAVGSRWSVVITGSLVCGLLVIAIAFWWYVRNWLLYDDLLAFNVWVQIAGGRPAPVTLASLIGEFQGFRISFWGNFGGVNLIAPDFVYTALDAFTVLAIVGLIVGIVRRTLPHLLWLPTVWLVFISISLVRWTWLTMASQGRLIFPAIAAVAVLFAVGLDQLRFTFYGSRRLSLAHLSFVILIPFSFLSPFAIIAPPYALPSRFANDAKVSNPVHLTFDNRAELVGYDLPQISVAPSDELPITVYWRALDRIDEDFSVSIRLLDAEGKIIGRWDAFPGGGLYPTRVWEPGEVIQDNYRVPVSLEAHGPAVGSIQVGLYRRVPLQDLTARDPQGNLVTPTIARFKIDGQSNVQVVNPVDHNFGDQMALIGYTRQISSDSLLVKLDWRALASMTEDYTVFVHLIDAQGNTLTQNDSQPQHSKYPTSFWDKGEIVIDPHPLTIPRDLSPGQYRIEIGVYRASDGTRLGLSDGSSSIIIETINLP
ncbi:MAG: glycosyltransferase family 39 protein [Chloroflexi bacterium]|nr:glycosyltransferase family 39 protein [Chloroflexota bacterium]